MKSEAQLERLFVRLVSSATGITVKLAPTHAGLPDRLVVRPNGWLELVELKTETGQLRPAQIVWHARAADRGCRVTVLRGETEIRAWAEQL